jgi:dTDP-4-amino-4,6-dideoxygalactose transaminase
VAIAAWARGLGLLVLEDCAHVWPDENTSAGRHGDAAFFSTQWSKPLTTGLGGYAILSNEAFRPALEDLVAATPTVGLRQALSLVFLLGIFSFLKRPKIYAQVQAIYRVLSNFGIVSGSSSVRELAGEMPAGYLRKMHPLQVWLFERRAPTMAQVQVERRKLAAYYDAYLSSCGYRAFGRTEESVLLRYPLLVQNRALRLAEAKAAHVQLGDWFDHPLHPFGSSLDGLNWRDELCPNAVFAARHVVNLPVEPRIDGEEARRIAGFVMAGPLPPEQPRLSEVAL